MLGVYNLGQHKVVKSDGTALVPLGDAPVRSQWVVGKQVRTSRYPKGVVVVAKSRRPTTVVVRALERCYMLNEALGGYSAPPVSNLGHLEAVGLPRKHMESFSSDVDAPFHWLLHGVG